MSEVQTHPSVLLLETSTRNLPLLLLDASLQELSHAAPVISLISPTGLSAWRWA